VAWFRRQRNDPGIGRAEAFGARPYRTAGVTVSACEGGLRLGVSWSRPRWQCWLGGGRRRVEKQYELDACGREVYEACDGVRSLRTIVHEFAERRQVSLAEAELSVTAFLRLLMQRGLIGMRTAEVKRES